METFCANGRKNRSVLTASTLYQTPYMHQVHRQSEFSYPPSRQSFQPYRKPDSLWDEPKADARHRKSHLCSIALTTAIFLVAIVVLTIAGLAFYMGALTTDTTNPLIAFTCSMKITRGDYYTSTLRYNYTSAYREKSRRYKYLLETVYQKSLLGSAFVSCVIEKFKNVSLTILFRLSFNRKKIPRSISNAENTIKEILVAEIQSRKTVFRHVKIDTNSILVKRYLENDYNTIYQREDVVKPKNLSNNNVKSNVVRKPNSNLTLTAHIPVKRKPIIEEPEINEEDLPVVQGSFKITKTEADLTEKKNQTKPISITKNFLEFTSTPVTTTKTVSPSTNKVTIAKSTTIKPTKLTTRTTSQQPITIKEAVTTIIPPILTHSPVHFIEEPWKPIRTPANFEQPMFPSSIHRVGMAETSPSKNTEIRIQPVYKSFTNPALTNLKYSSGLTEIADVVGHPIPVNKFSEMTSENNDNVESFLPVETRESDDNDDASVLENNKGYIEIETLKYVPSSSAPTTVTTENTIRRIFSHWELVNGTDLYNTTENSTKKIYNNTLQAIMVTNLHDGNYNKPIVQNISTIFHTLASNLDDLMQQTSTPSGEEMFNFDELVLDEPAIIGHGLVEVLNSTVEELLMKKTGSSTRQPFVTLIPVKSNSGLRNTLRPRPKMRNGQEGTDEEGDEFDDEFEGTTVEDTSSSRSFSTDVHETMMPTHLEYVTSVSSEINNVKVNRSGYTRSSEKIDNTDSALTVNGTKEYATTTKDDSTDPLIVVNVFSTVTNSSRIINSTDILSASHLQKLAEISNIYGNNNNNNSSTLLPDISTKALSNSYSINQSGLKILTKTFHKSPKKDEKIVTGINRLPLLIYASNETECDTIKLKCNDGTCLPTTARCNQLLDCPEGEDEKNCTCADYLRSQYLLRKICDGVVDCWDFSDENNCEWCYPGQYVCLHSQTCIDKNRICDGVKDCPQGDDERQCVLVAKDQKTAEELSYNSKGYLMIRKFGNWGKLCTENFEKVVTNSQSSWQISDIGRAVCKAMTYQDLDNIQRTKDDSESDTYFELSFSEDNETKSNLSFQKCDCPSQEVVTVKCKSLECGTRPQNTNHWARYAFERNFLLQVQNLHRNSSPRRSRIVGGSNANLGAWPWQAALYKEGEFQCGATLVSDRWLVSAGHCFFHSQNDYWVARLGALRRGTTLPSPYEQLRTITNIILHPDYVDVGFINDISLLQMQIPVIFSDYVRPICLPDSNTILENGRICTVVGWGQLFEVGRIFPDTLQEVQLPVISTAECRKKTIFLPLYQVTDNMFCAGYDRGGRDACLGDSGGPLMCQESGDNWTLYGVTSNGYGCARANRPGVYTKVANYMDWINEKMTSNKTAKSIVQLCKGHRCPLGECLPKSRICNGYIECTDGSDEKDCRSL